MMYLDTDVLLAFLKRDDWLKSAVDRDALEDPVTSTATVIEIYYVLGDEWSAVQLADVRARVETQGVGFVPLTPQHMDATGRLRTKYDRLGVFDAVHLGVALTEGEPIVSTDTLYPEIDEVAHLDPRDVAG